MGIKERAVGSSTPKTVNTVVSLKSAYLFVSLCNHPVVSLQTHHYKTDTEGCGVLLCKIRQVRDGFELRSAMLLSPKLHNADNERCALTSSLWRRPGVAVAVTFRRNQRLCLRHRVAYRSAMEFTLLGPTLHVALSLGFTRPGRKVHHSRACKGPHTP
jgi:hypothetical protein